MPPNGPELSCGSEAAKSSDTIRAADIALSFKKFFARGEIVDGRFRQLERLVRPRFHILEYSPQRCCVHIVLRAANRAFHTNFYDHWSKGKRLYTLWKMQM